MATKNGVSFRKVMLSSSKYGIKAPYAMKPKKVTIHNTDNEMPAINEINYMKGNNAQVSYHVAIDESEAIQSIPFDRNAWHSGDGGNGYGNRNTVAYEICRNYDRSRRTTNLLSPLKEQYAKAERNASLVIAADMYDLGINPELGNVKFHNDWSGKNCPSKILNEGRGQAVKALVVAEAIKYKAKMEGKDIPASKPSSPSAGSYVVKSGDTLWGIANKYGLTVAKVKSLNGLKSNLIIPGQKLNLVTSSAKPVSKPQKPKVDRLILDGSWGKNVTKRLQQILNTPVDGVISGQYKTSVTKNIHSCRFGSGGSLMVKALQRKVGLTGRNVDGYLGPITIKALQRYLGTPVTGGVSPSGSTMVLALQRRLNANKL